MPLDSLFVGLTFALVRQDDELEVFYHQLSSQDKTHGLVAETPFPALLLEEDCAEQYPCE